MAGKAGIAVYEAVPRLDSMKIQGRVVVEQAFQPVGGKACATFRCVAVAGKPGTGNLFPPFSGL